MIVAGVEVAAWVALGIGMPAYNPHSTAVGLEKDGRLVAGILYESFTGASVLMHFRCDEKRLSREFLFAIFDYPFNQLGVKRVRALVSSANKSSLRITEKLGSTRETVLEDYFEDGDGIVFCMRREDCRWLEFGDRNYGKKRTSSA